MHHVVPNASCAFFLNESGVGSGEGRVRRRGRGGDAAGPRDQLGDRLTGWVAEHQQPIVNSDAKLDLGAEAALYGLKYCLALPLVAEGHLAGVLSLYSADAFKEEQTQTLQFVTPHLGQMFLSSIAAAANLPPPLRRNPPPWRRADDLNSSGHYPRYLT